MHEEASIRISEILRDKPFALTLDTIEPLQKATGTSSNRAFTVTAGGQKHKLRVCDSETQAEMVERNATRFAHFVPKLHARDGRYVLLEFLEGYRQLSFAEMLSRTREIGRMCAEIHKYGDPVDHDPRRYFLEYLDSLRRQNAITPFIYHEMSAVYDENAGAVEAQVSLDLNDIYEANLMVGPAGTAYYVDEEAIRPAIRGLGIAGLIRHFDRQQQWFDFLDGYNEVDDSRFLTPAYFALLRLVFGVRAAHLHLKDGRPDRAIWILERIQRELNWRHAVSD